VPPLRRFLFTTDLAVRQRPLAVDKRTLPFPVSPPLAWVRAPDPPLSPIPSLPPPFPRTSANFPPGFSRNSSSQPDFKIFLPRLYAHRGPQNIQQTQRYLFSPFVVVSSPHFTPRSISPFFFPSLVGQGFSVVHLVHDSQRLLKVPFVSRRTLKVKACELSSFRHFVSLFAGTPLPSVFFLFCPAR